MPDRCLPCKHGEHEYCLEVGCLCLECCAGDSYDPEQDVARPDYEGVKV